MDTISSTLRNKIAKNIKPVVNINYRKMSIAKQIKIVGWKKKILRRGLRDQKDWNEVHEWARLQRTRMNHLVLKFTSKPGWESRCVNTYFRNKRLDWVEKAFKKTVLALLLILNAYVIFYSQLNRIVYINKNLNPQIVI